MDFFTVITANFRILYCLFLIHDNRREIINFNVTDLPQPGAERSCRKVGSKFSERLARPRNHSP
jgi:hypothetical protein